MADDPPFMNTIDRLPVTIKGGHDSVLIDQDDSIYVDLWGDEGVSSLGYKVEFNTALQEFINNGSPQRLPDMYHNDLRKQAATVLTKRAGFDRVFFCNSGAEANETAIKLARRYWHKNRLGHHRKWVLTLNGNFHGRTGFALSASDSSDSPYHKLGFGDMAPCFGVIDDDLDINHVRVWDGDKYVGYANIAPELRWSEVAAIIMAPILGNNTVKTYPSEFWAKLQHLRGICGVLVIFDEVQVGMGRTGAFCAHHNGEVTCGFRPDILCLGKGIAMGLPAAAVLADTHVASAFEPGVHFSTFGGSMIVCHMMLWLMRWLDRNIEHVCNCGDYLRGAFQKLKAAGVIEQFDGAGVHWGFTPTYHNCMEFCEAARANGILLVTHRKHAPIRFTPPLNTPLDTLIFCIDAIEKTHKQLTQKP